VHEDREAEFERFYRSEERRVLRLCYGVLGDSELARDAAQEAWLRYLRYIQGERPEYSVPLLVTVALNAARDWQRRRRRRLEELRPDTPEHAAPSTAGGDPDLMDAMRRLPDQEREAILLHYGLDLPLADIARVLEKRTGAVKSILHRGRAHLRSLLAAEEGISSGH
jgi:RNA polymerase sigma-70 factor (ECF subfamily)